MVRFSLKIKLNKASLEKAFKKKQDLIRNNIISVLRHKAVPNLIQLVMEGYDSLSERADTGPDDPTNPSRWRDEFLIKLEEDARQMFVILGDKFSISLGDKDFLGYNPDGAIDPDDTEPLHWMVFFIEGLLGDWAFITPEDYVKLTKGGNYKSDWGRFSEGFMVSRENYELNEWHRIIPFSQVRHPFSGFSPLDIFEEALREFNIRPFIQLAIDAAAQGREI